MRLSRCTWKGAANNTPGNARGRYTFSGIGGGMRQPNNPLEPSVLACCVRAAAQRSSLAFKTAVTVAENFGR
jgi:hypothetical protein